MSTIALAMVLVAALCHALWNLAAKRVDTDGYAFVWCYDVASVLLWAPLAIASLVAAGHSLSPTLLLAPLVSGVLHIAYQLPPQTGCARADRARGSPAECGVGQR